MPNRIIREGLLDSERVNSLSDPSFRFYVHLCLAADDAGRYDGRAEIMRSRLFPLSSRRASDVQKALKETDKLRLTFSYRCTDKPYVQIARWQRCGNAEHSKFPDPDGGFKITYVLIDTRDGMKQFVASSIIEVPADIPYLPDKCGISGDLNTETDTKTRTETSTKTETPPATAGLPGFYEQVQIPRELVTSEFVAAWRDWAEHRYAKEKPTLKAVQVQMKRCLKMGEIAAIAALEHSTASGYTGIYPAPADRYGRKRDEDGRPEEGTGSMGIIPTLTTTVDEAVALLGDGGEE